MNNRPLIQVQVGILSYRVILSSKLIILLLEILQLIPYTVQQQLIMRIYGKDAFQ